RGPQASRTLQILAREPGPCGWGSFGRAGGSPLRAAARPGGPGALSGGATSGEARAGGKVFKETGTSYDLRAHYRPTQSTDGQEPRATHSSRVIFVAKSQPRGDTVPTRQDCLSWVNSSVVNPACGIPSDSVSTIETQIHLQRIGRREEELVVGTLRMRT
ncbi:unnamed protein product, partial [Amoebophrya sp. A120]